MDMEAIDAQRKDSSQRQHASHRGHVVQIGLRVLDVSVRRVRRTAQLSPQIKYTISK